MWQFIFWFFISVSGFAVTSFAGYKAKEAWDIWHKKDYSLQTGIGGEGGEAKAINGGLAMGGNGGPGGGIGGGKGGDGGSVESIGKGSIAIGGDGGGGARGDGRGGKGAESPLKKLPLEVLKQWGLTGNEGYGSGGDGGDTQEYSRCLDVLKTLSLEYSKEYPSSKLILIQNLKMPPVEWVNKRLSQKKENFWVEFNENNTDFFFHSKTAGNNP